MTWRAFHRLATARFVYRWERQCFTFLSRELTTSPASLCLVLSRSFTFFIKLPGNGTNSHPGSSKNDWRMEQRANRTAYLFGQMETYLWIQTFLWRAVVTLLFLQLVFQNSVTSNSPIKCIEFSSITPRLTDARTNWQLDELTDASSYRNTTLHLKREQWSWEKNRRSISIALTFIFLGHLNLKPR